MSETATEPMVAIPGPVESEPVRPFRVRSYGLTDAGKVREANEDHFVVVELARTMDIHHSSVTHAESHYRSHRGHLFLVADGMGGHRAGEVASALSVATIEAFVLNSLRRFFNLKGSEESNVMREFQSALLQADARIFEEAERHPQLLGMGTTLTMAFAVTWKLYVAHAGDSRCYLYSGGELRQLTDDHTMVAELVRRGALPPAAAAQHPYRHMITNVLGGHEQGVRVELHALDLEPGDTLLLCSDGLSEMLPDERIANILRNDSEPQAACEHLVAAANEAGGRDNITAVIAQFTNEPSA